MLFPKHPGRKRAVIAKTVSAITRERYVDTHFYLIESASVTKGSIRQLFMGRQLPITLMLWVVFFMSLLIIYLLSSWMPTLLNHRGIDLQHASWVRQPSGREACIAGR